METLLVMIVICVLIYGLAWHDQTSKRTPRQLNKKRDKTNQGER